jgi:hypothetical protein
MLWLGMGIAVSFDIGANDSALSVAGFVLLCTLPITASIAARRAPMISGLALLACFCVILILIYLHGGLSDIRTVLSRPLLWPYLLFGMAYLISSCRIRGTVSA